MILAKQVDIWHFWRKYNKIRVGKMWELTAHEEGVGVIITNLTCAKRILSSPSLSYTIHIVICKNIFSCMALYEIGIEQKFGIVCKETSTYLHVCAGMMLRT